MSAAIVLGVIAILIISAIKIHNGIINRYNATVRAWADVVTEERNKNQLFPEIERLAESFKEHEGSVLKGVTELRAAISRISENDIDTNQLKAIQTQTSSLIKNLVAVSEAYPELKSSEVFNNVINKFTLQHDNITASLRIFNRNVELFNSGIEIFPNSIVNNTFTKKVRLNRFHDHAAEAGFDYKPNF